MVEVSAFIGDLLLTRLALACGVSELGEKYGGSVRHEAHAVSPMPRMLASGSSLAERYPGIAATWDREANGELDPTTVSVSSAQQVHWRCAAGHTWTEKVAQRTSNAAWKHGDPAACRICTGYLIEVEFACGHTAFVPQLRAMPERLCPDCWKSEKPRRDAAFAARIAEGRERAAQVKEACQADAPVQAEILWQQRGYDRLPDVLHRPARAALVAKLTFSLIGERAFGNPPHPELMALIGQFEQITAGRVDVAADRPLDLLGSRFWAPSLGPSKGRAEAERETVSSLSSAARAALRLEGDVALGVRLDLALARALDDADAEAETADLTGLLTDALKEWAFGQGWRSWRELHVPLRDQRVTGRLDLVIFRPDGPDIVVEIDARPNARSIAKLELARDVGALPIWLRWQRGTIETLDGVSVVDLTGSVGSS